jgi:uncharacterized protein (DUF736 family)
MTILGRFTEADGGYSGPIRTLAVQTDLVLVPTGAEGAAMPSHRVLAGEVECGAAWPAEDESGLLNVRIDDPSWAGPIRARLVRGRDDELLLVWRRPSSG